VGLHVRSVLCQKRTSRLAQVLAYVARRGKEEPTGISS
jgi:hypothetical protein